MGSSRRGLVVPASVCLVLWLAVLGACGGGSTPAPEVGSPPGDASAPLAAYVLLSESPPGAAVAFARVIVDSGAGCPNLVGAGNKASLLMSKRHNPHGFSVDVCEAEVPFAESFTVSGTSLTLPVARRQVSRVAVFGDTGCKPGDDHQGDCSLSDASWPFYSLAKDAAGRGPDLVVHVGDYNYRGTPSGFDRDVNGEQKHFWYYDAGDGTDPSEKCGLADTYYSQNSTGNADRDAWPAWRDDFFTPAADLLAAAPWAFSRGNHELCSHAGPGWFYFLDASSDLPSGGGQLSCPDQDVGETVESHLQMVPPRVIALADLELAVLDSSNACDELNNFASQYAQQLDGVAAKLSSSPAWLVGHRPPWGADGDASGPPYNCDGTPGSGPTPTYDALNRTLQCALASPSGSGSSSPTVAAVLLPKLTLVLAGHMHRYESLDFAATAARPPSLIIGNSGVQEDSGPPNGTFQGTLDGETASGQAVEEFGYLVLERDASGTWNGSVVTPDPTAWQPTLPTCDPTATPLPPLCVEGLAP